MPGIETGLRREGMEGPEREAGEPHHIIVVDDQFSDNLAGVFSKQEKGKLITKITQAKDLESALDVINSVDDPRGAGVITDMFMPEKEGSFKADEGLNIIGEIFEFYGVKRKDAQASIARVKAVLDRYGDRIRDYADKFARRVGYRVTDEPIPQEINEAFGPKKATMKKFSEVTVPLPVDLERYYGVEISELLEKRLLVRDKVGNLERTPQFFKNISGSDRLNHCITGEDFIMGMSIALTWGNDGGILAGARITETAYKKGLPVVIISGGHDLGSMSHFIAKYLHDKGFIDSPSVCKDMIEYVHDPDRKGVVKPQIRKDAQEVANRNSYFEMSKRVDINNPDKRNQLNVSTLQIIKKSLDSKISQKLY